MPHSPSTTENTAAETARSGVQGLTVERRFTEAGVDPSARGETLDAAAFVRLAQTSRAPA